MEAAEYAFGGEGLVVLDEVGRKVVGGEGVLVEDFCEPTATISEESGLNEFNGIQLGGKNLHSFSLAGWSGF